MVHPNISIDSSSTGEHRSGCPRGPELLAPAGNFECARAAIENGADAIYFGLNCGFNARYRAQNFTLDELDDLTRFLRERGKRGYATMNTLVFPSELPRLVEVIQRIASAGVDAVLVQDFGVARLVRTIAPELEIHASTQMSLTSAETIAVARRLGISRVVLARELSVTEITRIAEDTDMPLEVFIHGALCVAYSGQCLTSESLGGRSANRGQCAQACRLPYELVCDGLTRDLQDVKYLLSPQDLAGYASIPELIRAGVASLKIEGRLKTPEYVANITSQYRRAIGAALEHRECPITRDDHREMELSFSRGLAPGWLEGNDHKRLVPGRHSAKLGIVLGTILRVRGQEIQLQLAAPLALGDGIALHVVGQETPQGSRVYSIHNQQGSVKHASEGDTVWVECRHGDLDQVHLQPKTEVYKNDDPQLNRRLRQTFTDVDPRERQPVDMTVTAMAGDPLVLTAKLASGQTATFTSNDPLPVAIKHPANRETLAEKLGRLGGTPFRLGTLDCHLHRDPIVPVALLNEARRAVVTQLLQSIQTPPRRTVDVASGRRLLKPIRSNRDTHSETTNTSPVQLVVLCRTLDQLRAAVEQGVPLCYADFHDVRQYREARQLAKGSNTHLGLSSVRIQKPGEMGLLRYLTKAEPDCVLARNLAAIDYFVQRNVPVVADFSLNVANHRSAEWIRSLGVDRVTVSYDLNRDQLFDLLKAVPGDWMEIVLHQHMPMFHMEHCVFCSVLSPGTNKTNCGRPCDRHVVQLRDRVGAEHTLQADVACRNTLYNSTPQSGAEWLSEIHAVGVQYFRIELLDESPSDTLSTIQGYRDLLDGRVAPAELLRRLAAINRVGVTRGTLETKRDPLAII